MSLLVPKTKTPQTDADLDTLLKGVSSGDRDAFKLLYDGTRTSLYSFALSILKNTYDAEDALHDCYMSVWHNAGQYRSQGKPLAWLMTITRNLCFQKIRERRKEADAFPDEAESRLSFDERIDVEDRMVLTACLEQLSEQERQIVTLHAVSGFKHKEIAELLGIPLGTVLSKYQRAIKRLNQYLR